MRARVDAALTLDAREVPPKVVERLKAEYSVPSRYESTPWGMMRWVASDDCASEAGAQKEVIDALGLTKLVYNLNILSQNAALAAMDYADEILAHNIPPTLAARQHFMDALKDVPNLTVYPSATNFVLVRVPDGPAMVKALHDADICVRSYKAADLKNCLRITITTDDVVRRVVAVMTEEAKKYA